MSPARPSVSVRWRRIHGLSDVALGSYVLVEHLMVAAQASTPTTPPLRFCGRNTSCVWRNC